MEGKIWDEERGEGGEIGEEMNRRGNEKIWEDRGQEGQVGRRV